MSFIYAHSLTDIIAILIYYVTFNTTTSLWKRQNGWWKVSEADWFYFSFQDLSCFFYDPSWSESNFILFLLFLFDPIGPSPSELIQPRLAVRVDLVRLLYLPHLNEMSYMLHFL